MLYKFLYKDELIMASVTHEHGSLLSFHSRMVSEFNGIIHVLLQSDFSERI